MKQFDNFALVKCVLETGRTHQIRVHFAYIGHHLLSDSLYGTTSNLIDRQALHCYNLKFVHPVSNETLDLYASVPDDIGKLITSVD